MRTRFLVPPILSCGPWCPSQGHRVRVSTEDTLNLSTYAETRVRALHALLDMRSAGYELVTRYDVAALVNRVWLLGAGLEIRAMDLHTVKQTGRLGWAASYWLARRLTHIMQAREVIARSTGFSEGSKQLGV